MTGKELTQEQIRDALIEKIRKAWPSGLPENLERSLDVGSIDDLRRYLAIAELATEVPAPCPARDEDATSRLQVVKMATGAGRASHTYVLAKDEDGPEYTGPSWCPFNLWSDFYWGAKGPQPDLTKECARRLIFSPGAEELWAKIAVRYERPDNIASELSVRCAEFLSHWRATPKQRPREFQDARLELKRRAEQLAIELERFFDRWDYGDESPINFTQLLTEDEQDQMAVRIKWHNHLVANRARGEAGARRKDWNFGVDVPTHDTWTLLLGNGIDTPGIVPNLSEMLRRIGQLFAEDGEVAPLERPNADNAERNYFCRRLIAWFKTSYGEVSPNIVAGIVSVFYPQGITDNEVSQQLGRLPSGRRLPTV